MSYDVTGDVIKSENVESGAHANVRAPAPVFRFSGAATL